MVQPLEYWRYSGNPTSEHFVYPATNPRIVNIMRHSGRDLVQFMNGIHKWSRSPLSDVSGTWHIHSPARIADKQWIGWISTSFLICLLRLLACYNLPGKFVIDSS
jgi:hypothetical protein